MSVYQRAKNHALKMLGLTGLGVVFIIAVDLWIGHSSIAFAITSGRDPETTCQVPLSAW